MGSTFSAWWPGQYVGGYADAAPHGTLGGKGPEATTPARSPTRRWRVMGSRGLPHHDVPYDSEERPCRRTTLPARPAQRRSGRQRRPSAWPLLSVVRDVPVVPDVVVRTSSAAHYPPPPSWRPGGGCGFWTFTPQGTV